MVLISTTSCFQVVNYLSVSISFLFWTKTALQEELKVIHKYPNHYKGIKYFCNTRGKKMYQRPEELEKWWKPPNVSGKLFYFITQGVFISMPIRKRHRDVWFPYQIVLIILVWGAAPATSDLCENLCWQAPWVSKLNVALECF